MGQRSVPAPFLTKTYQLVDDRSTDDVVSWNESGTTFVVWKTADLARDLLPNYFKHNNFSSFVRQLNTYGFRKIVPDKWEFANENFKRGEKELLAHIRRRRRTAVASNIAVRNLAGDGEPSSPSISGDDLGSTSTSSPDTKNVGSVEAPARAQFADLTDENQKLKRDNELLSTELSQVKKQCDKLAGFLTNYVRVAPDQINRIMRQGSRGFTREGSDGVIGAVVNFNDDDEDDDEEEEEEEEESIGEENGEGLKLFGVWVAGNSNNNKKRRGRGDEDVGLGTGATAHRKEMKTVDFDAPWMKICSSPRGTASTN